MSVLWTSAKAETATGGESTTEWETESVSIDTRTLQPGALFVALTDQRDGHDFVAQALERGAAAAMVSRIPDGVPEDAPLLVVPDVLEGLRALAKAARKRSKARVVGITGSVGKTTTKEMLRVMLAGQGRVHAAEKSYNNHWGVPLTLARMPEDADFAVIEIGMNAPGEIAPLARLARLDVAVITTVAPAHLAAFASVAEIAREKASILEGLRDGGTAVLNTGIETGAILMEQAAVSGARCVGFGRAPDVAARLVSAQVVGVVTQVRARLNLGGAQVDLSFDLQSPGAHFAMNAVAALAAVAALGADVARAAAGLADWRPYEGRGVCQRVLLNGAAREMAASEAVAFDMIDDAYNANPVSVAAALDTLAALTPRDGLGRRPRGRRIAILGDMLELGPDGPDLHAALADHGAMAAIDQVHCIGPLSRALWDALPEGKRGHWEETSSELVPRADDIVDAGDVVLVKGSLGSRLGPMVTALRALGQTTDDSAAASAAGEIS